MQEILIDEVKSLALESIELINNTNNHDFSDEIISDFVKQIQKAGSFEHYKKINSQARLIFEKIQNTSNIQKTRIFLRLSILFSVKKICISGDLLKLPSLTFKCQIEHLKRIASLSSVTDEYLDIGSDLFQKEISLTNLRLYAAGAQLIDIRCGIPKSIILKRGFLYAPFYLFYFLRNGGFKPYFQIHTHKFNLRKFNYDGWIECYMCCAELYNLHPECLGMFGASWFYDPALDEISPRLSYLRQVPVSGGAKVIKYCSDEDSKQNAISTSETRKKLYLAGEYLPTSFMLVWPKSMQIKWAKSKYNSN